ncbi:MAG: formate--phosphoribosylaminoimidazolecarboxamide ligase [Candidatus Hydrothermarchaeales archaeon]
MIEKGEALDILKDYNKEEIAVATLGSHSALQILKGAKEEGFRAIAICKKEQKIIYERFRVADEIITLNDYKDIVKEENQQKLREKNCVIVPHGSLIAYVGVDDIEENLRLPILGNRRILRWESDRTMERQWLEDADIKLPKEFKDPKDIDRLSLVKFPGARGGRDYFLAKNYDSFKRKSSDFVKRGKITEEDVRNATVQEYISGVNMYLSYFYSPLKDEVELFCIDKRYESNIDGLTRIPANDQKVVYEDPRFDASYVVVGNFPIVARESLLNQVFEMGDRIVESSKKIAPPGMMGAFCLETMINDDLKFIAFEISARIVAGTNPFTSGSPYSYLLYGSNMSMGRRIARELKNAIDQDMVAKIIT